MSNDTEWDYLCPDDCCAAPDGKRSVMVEDPPGFLTCPQCNDTQHLTLAAIDRMLADEAERAEAAAIRNRAELLRGNGLDLGAYRRELSDMGVDLSVVTGRPDQ